MLGGSLVVFWTMLFSGGMWGVVGWVSVISIGQVLVPLTLIGVAIHAARRRRFSRPMAATAAIAAFSLWPALWGFGLFAFAYPASLSTVKPAVSVRLPADGPIRVAWGGDRLAVNRHAFTPDQRWAYDLLMEPAGLESSRLADYGCYGKPVVAPVAATVRHTIDGCPDQDPRAFSPDFQNPLGNAVMLALTAAAIW